MSQMLCSCVGLRDTVGEIPYRRNPETRPNKSRVGHPQEHRLKPALLEDEDAGGDDDQGQGEGGDGDFPDETHGEGTQALMAHLAEIGAKTDTGESEQEGPTRQVG